MFREFDLDMITEDYVSFETAELLKETGFDEECIGFYTPEKEIHFTFLGETNSTWLDDSISAPTLQMAMKWLRGVHHLHIDIVRGPKGYHPWIQTVPLGVNIVAPSDILGIKTVGLWRVSVDTYEEACEAGIRYCLENIV